MKICNCHLRVDGCYLPVHVGYLLQGRCQRCYQKYKDHYLKIKMDLRVKDRLVNVLDLRFVIGKDGLTNVDL